MNANNIVVSACWNPDPLRRGGSKLARIQPFRETENLFRFAPWAPDLELGISEDRDLPGRSLQRLARRRRAWAAANPSAPEANCSIMPGSGSRVTVTVTEYRPSSKWDPSKGSALNPVMPTK